MKALALTVGVFLSTGFGVELGHALATHGQPLAAAIILGVMIGFMLMLAFVVLAETTDWDE